MHHLSRAGVIEFDYILVSADNLTEIADYVCTMFVSGVYKMFRWRSPGICYISRKIKQWLIMQKVSTLPAFVQAGRNGV